MTTILAALAPFAPDLLASLGGLVVSPLFDFFKKLFVKGSNDTPERTMGNLATTNPVGMTAYAESLIKLEDAKIKFFNRDVVGTLSVWVSDIRAAIRPITVIISLICLFLDGFGWLDLSTGARLHLRLA